ncbi:MAG: dTDP-4-dehydrorhamnose reductase [Syntrophobacteraceae bacterium]
MNSNIVVIGSTGMLGAELVEALNRAGLKAIALARSEMDITRPETLKGALARVASTGLLINCAAYTAVDKAETEPEAAFAANREGPANLADECRRVGLPLIHVSTDYVFDGKSTRPYREQDPVNPINIYGLSKQQGEDAIRSRLAEHIIVRTSWLYGTRGKNFVKTILKLGFERDELTVVCDQYGCPTWTYDLAACLVRVSQRILSRSAEKLWGTYHFCGKGPTTWFDFASAILAEAERNQSGPGGVARVLPVATSQYPTAAARPVYSVLDCSKIEAALGVSPPAWNQSVARCVRLLLEGAGA